MSRKPIDQQQPHECRQAVWEWIRAYAVKHGPDHTFTLPQIDVLLEETSIRTYLAALHKGGYLDVLQMGTRGVLNIYRLIKDCGVDAPRLRKDGQPVTQGRGRYQMWRSMAVIKAFTPAELANYASTEEHQVAIGEAASYCKEICKAGYLSARSDGSYMVVLAQRHGPHPPQVQRTKQIYDPNLKKVVWSRVEGGAE